MPLSILSSVNRASIARVVYKARGGGAIRNLIPTDISAASLQIWLDAADSTTIAASTNNVSQWNDKSGGGRDFTATNNPKTGTTTRNGLNVMNLVTNNTSYFSRSNYTLSQYFSMFFVAYGGNAPSGIIRGNPDYYYSLVQNSTTSFYFLVGNGPSTWITATTVTIPAVSDIYISELIAYNNGTNTTQNGYINGTIYSNASGSNASTSTTMYLGSSTGTSQYLNGYFAEAIIYNTSLSDSDRIKIEGYLAWKWGLQANLPSGHLYKSAAPTVTSYNINNTGLLHYYPFDINFSDYINGYGIIDISGTNLTLSNTQTKLTTNSLPFPSSNTEYCDISSCNFTANSGMTIAFWFYGNTTTQTLYGRIFDFSQYATGTANSTAIFSSWQSSNNVQISWGAVGIANIAVTQNTWHHFCFTASASSTPVYTFYLDNVTKSATPAQASYFDTSLPYKNCRIGRATVNEFYRTNGFMNSFVVFNRCLTPTEIGYLYNYPSNLTITSAATT